MDLKEAMHRVVAEGYRVIAPGGLDITGWLEQESLLNTLVRPVKPVERSQLCTCGHRQSVHSDDEGCHVGVCPCTAFVDALTHQPLTRSQTVDWTEPCGCGHNRSHHARHEGDGPCNVPGCNCAEWAGTSGGDGTPQSRTADPVGALCGQAEDSEAIGCGHRMDYHLGARGVHIPGRCHAAGCACPKFIP